MSINFTDYNGKDHSHHISENENDIKDNLYHGTDNPMQNQYYNKLW